MIVETYLYDLLVGSKITQKKNNTHWCKLFGLGILKIIIIIIAVYLAWDCNKEINLIMKLINALFAGLFSTFYILYYSIYRTLLGNNCYSIESQILSVS